MNDLSNKNSPKIETDRLILRKVNNSDIKYFFDILKDEKVNKFLPWFPMKSIEHTEEFLNREYINHYKKELSFKYAICLKQDNIPIGYIQISDNSSNDLGYGLKKEFWSLGIISEACNALIDYIKELRCFEYITATHDINNIASGKVMQNIGMKYMYSYEEMWQPKNINVTFRMYQMNFDCKTDFVYNQYKIKYKWFVENL